MSMITLSVINRDINCYDDNFDHDDKRKVFSKFILLGGIFNGVCNIFVRY